MPSQVRVATQQDDDFLEQLSCLETGRSSARSRSSGRSGLILSHLEPPHRIPSHFPVPAGTLAQVPGLNHPDLSRGQRRYLHSTAQIYSMEGSKRALSDSYYSLLMSELLRGGGAPDSHKRYTVWIYGNHKRLYETNPAIWRPPRKLKHHCAGAPGEDKAVTAESGEEKQQQQQRAPSDQCGDGSAHSKRSLPDKREIGNKALASSASDGKSSPKASVRKSQNPVSPATWRRDSPVAGGPRARAGTSEEEKLVVVTAASGAAAPRPPARQKSAHRSGQQRGAADKNTKGGNDDPTDGQRPRDLSKIMY